MEEDGTGDLVTSEAWETRSQSVSLSEEDSPTATARAPEPAMEKQAEMASSALPATQAAKEKQTTQTSEEGVEEHPVQGAATGSSSAVEKNKGQQKGTKMKWKCKGCGHIIADKERYRTEAPEMCKKCPPGTAYFGPDTQRALQQKFAEMHRQAVWQAHGSATGWSTRWGAKGSRAHQWTSDPPTHSDRWSQKNRKNDGSPTEKGEEDNTTEIPWRNAQAGQEPQPAMRSCGQNSPSHSRRRRSRSRSQKERQRKQEAALRRKQEEAEKRQEEERKRAERESKRAAAKDRIQRNLVTLEQVQQRILGREAVMKEAARMATLAVDQEEQHLSITYQATMLKFQLKDQKFKERLLSAVQRTREKYDL